MTFRVSDGYLTTSEGITITVTAPNAPPVLSSIGNKTVTVGQLLQFAISATDSNGDTMTYSATNIPSGATFNSSTRTFSWTPTAAGIFSNVSFTVSDGSLTDSESIAITVNAAVNEAPVLAPIGNKSIAVGQLLQFTISATDLNGDTLTYYAANLPSGATFNLSTATFSWAPINAETYPYVTFTVSDGSLTDSETITISANAAVNNAPILMPIGNRSAIVGQLLQFTISASDPDGNLLTYSAYNLPPGATFTPSTRTFSWIPTSAGTYSYVTFIVSDGYISDSESITIVVGGTTTQGTEEGNGTNAAQVFNSIGNKSGSIGQTLQFTILAADQNGDALTYSASNLPAGASFNPSTRTFFWTPDSTGTHNVTFTVSDGSLADSMSIIITITSNIESATEKNDTKAPEISGTTSEIESGIVVVRWITDEPSTSQVEYWASPHQFSPLEIDNFVTKHEVRLTGLNPSTKYLYKTLSKDRAGNLSVSPEYTLTTLPSTLPGDFTVSELAITPAEAKTGEEITIGVLVTNNTNAKESYELVLRIGGIKLTTKTIELAAGEQRTVEFTTTRYATGSSVIEINGATGDLIVRAPTKQGASGLLTSALVIVPLVSLCITLVWWYRKRGLFRI